MADSGSKLTPEATAAAESLVHRLGAGMAVRSRMMFGGYGIFQDDRMFALVDSAGTVYFKVGDRGRADHEGAHRHGRMPYFEVPERVLADERLLHAWAENAAAAAHDHASSRPRRRRPASGAGPGRTR